MDDIVTWLSKAWRWLSDDQNNRGVKTIRLVIRIFGAIGGAYKTIKMTGPRVRIIFSLLTNMFIVFWKRLQIASMISCTRMRLVILLGEPASLVKVSQKNKLK